MAESENAAQIARLAEKVDDELFDARMQRKAVEEENGTLRAALAEARTALQPVAALPCYFDNTADNVDRRCGACPACLAKAVLGEHKPTLERVAVELHAGATGNQDIWVAPAIAEYIRALQAAIPGDIEREMRRAEGYAAHAREAWDERDKLRRQLEQCTAERTHARQEWYAWMKLAVSNGVSLGEAHMPKVEGVK